MHKPNTTCILLLQNIQSDLSLLFKLHAISELNMKFIQLCKWLKRVRLHTSHVGGNTCQEVDPVLFLKTLWRLQPCIPEGYSFVLFSKMQTFSVIRSTILPLFQLRRVINFEKGRKFFWKILDFSVVNLGPVFIAEKVISLHDPSLWNRQFQYVRY